jgi:hypothetical protein
MKNLKWNLRSRPANKASIMYVALKTTHKTRRTVPRLIRAVDLIKSTRRHWSAEKFFPISYRWVTFDVNMTLGSLKVGHPCCSQGKRSQIFRGEFVKYIMERVSVPMILAFGFRFHDRSVRVLPAVGQVSADVTEFVVTMCVFRT